MTKTICLMVAMGFAGPALAADKAPAAPAAAPAAAPGKTVAAAPAAAPSKEPPASGGASAPGSAAAPGGMPDMTKMGPLSRPVTKPDKKGIDELYKAFEDAMKKGDINSAADLVDFPVIMLSDDSKGVVKHFNATRDQWIAIFGPFVTNMPKDVKMTAKHTPTFLSDTLAVSIEQDSMTMGKTKGKWNAMSVLTLVDGKWKFKQLAEAGWGDMPAPAVSAVKAPAGSAPSAKK